MVPNRRLTQINADLVVSQFRHTENLATFSGTQTINHPLGLATVAQAGVIRETLDLAMAKKEGEPEQPEAGMGGDE